MLQEIHHRVKNYLQLVESLLNLQERKVGDQATKASLQVIRSRIGTMAVLHERLYQSDNVGAQNFVDYLEDIVQLAADSFLRGNKKIGLHITGEGTVLSLDKAIPVGLIVNELVCNAYKHGFAEQENGKITITVDREEDRIRLVVKDNGKGLPEDLNDNSLGIRIIHSLTRQLHGEFNYYNDEEGAIGDLTFSMNNQNDERVA